MQNLTYGVSGFHVFEEAQQYTMANRFIQRRKAKDTQTDFPLLRMDNSSCTCPAFLGGGFSYVFCYFVSVLHPPCAPYDPEVCCIPLACCLLSCVLAGLFYVSSLPALLLISIWTSCVSSCLFLMYGYI